MDFDLKKNLKSSITTPSAYYHSFGLKNWDITILPFNRVRERTASLRHEQIKMLARVGKHPWATVSLWFDVLSDLIHSL